MMDANGNTVTRGVAPPAKEVETTLVLSPDGTITSGENGAVFLRIETLELQFQGPFRRTSQVMTRNIIGASEVSTEAQRIDFPFVKVETLPWAGHREWFYGMNGY